MKPNMLARFAAGSALAATCFALGGSVIAPPAALAQEAQAPPVQDTYNWHDVPTGQHIEITHAAFDQGGYRLYASTGEMIVVPFENQNLYVMKFGRTSGSMYFINDGSTPTLYIPAGGYLENDSVSGAHWYPFPQNYAYTGPVYVGCAPSWPDFVDMGWYPGMVYYGGYYGYHPWHFGLSFSPFPGLFVSIGGHPYYGWGGYHSYYAYHPYNRVYVHNFAAYNYHSIPRRSVNVFVNQHNTFVHSHTVVRNTVVHNNFHNASVTHGGGGFRNSGAGEHGTFNRQGAFGHSSPASHAPFGGATGHSSSFSHAPDSHGAFGGNRTGGSFGQHSSGSFGGNRPGGFGGGDHPSGGGSFGGGNHTFGGGGGGHTGGGGGGFHGGGGGGHMGGGGGGGRHR